MIDGTIARKVNQESEFGSILDTIADLIFVFSATVKILPILKLSLTIKIGIVFIGLIKMINIGYGIILYQKFVSVHSFMNKVVGAILFIFPFTIAIFPVNNIAMIICFISTLAAMHEFYIISTKQIHQYR